MMGICSVMRLFVCITAVFWFAQAQDYCCEPDQYVIKAGQLNGLELPYFGGTVQVNSIDMATDYGHRKIGTMVDSVTLGQQSKIRFIYDFKEDVMYTIIDGECYIGTPPPNLDDQCIPDTVRFDGSGTIGNDQLTVDSYSYDEDIPKVRTGSASVTVSRDHCIPVSATFVGEATDNYPPVPLVSSTFFYNFTKGISDPDYWFEVPSFCPKSAPGKLLWTSEKFDVVSRLMSIFYSMRRPTSPKK